MDQRAAPEVLSAVAGIVRPNARASKDQGTPTLAWVDISEKGNPGLYDRPDKNENAPSISQWGRQILS